jgi:hypothetical protein
MSNGSSIGNMKQARQKEKEKERFSPRGRAVVLGY